MASESSTPPDIPIKTEHDNDESGIVRQRSHSISHPHPHPHSHSHGHHRHRVALAKKPILPAFSNKYLDPIILHLILAFFGIVGVLARIGLDRLTSFQGSHYGGVLWSNFAGCLIMGALAKSKDLFSDLIVEEPDFSRIVDIVEHHGSEKPVLHRAFKSKAEIPLYVGLATGACGSITSFSSFIISLFELSSHQLTPGVAYPNPGYGVPVFLSYLIVTIAVSFSGFYFGHHLIDALEKSRNVSLARYTLLIELVLSMLGLLGWIVVLVLTIVRSEWRYWTFSCLFGPFGVYARFWLGKLLNKKSTKFFFGTFAANIFASILISILVLLQHGKRHSGSLLVQSVLHCQVISALQDGFCGNFSTISTFVSELSGFKRKRYAYFYGGVSIGLGFAMAVLILGTYSWAVGLSESSAC
ncbi:Fex2p [Sugiyamaella lignohabitans]|uniref:Fex2p n=1 Tax=Sugiyamaella lignohabitans TaxID=796027 RepID=A0A167DD01_9ASCO|nr:Fex2p [Sugiyamaella lignohabitans]ANB12776.1 Fex2p [Sugiyamaella lignohabitans]